MGEVTLYSDQPVLWLIDCLDHSTPGYGVKKENMKDLIRVKARHEQLKRGVARNDRHAPPLGPIVGPVLVT